MLSMLRAASRAVVRTTGGAVVALGAVEVTTHLISEGRSSKVYHRLADDVATPLLRAVLDGEAAHDFALSFLASGWAPRHRPSAAEQGLEDASVTLFDGRLRAPNAVGLAAGFDKDGVAVRELLGLGFGLVEVGTVTPRPQPGNPKPRMFRLEEEGAVINRYGFNSAGQDAVQRNMIDAVVPLEQRVKHKLEELSHSHSHSHSHNAESNVTPSEAAKPSWLSLTVSGVLNTFRFGRHTQIAEPPRVGVVGVNLGKNKDTEADKAVDDYRELIRAFGPYADYLVINVSSPNTPGLRDLQHTTALRDLLTKCIKARDELEPEFSEMRGEGWRPPALLVKLAPDLQDEELDEIANVLMQVGVDGVVLTNTTNARPAWITSEHRDEPGGLSGLPLKDRSNECIRRIYAATEGRLPIIGVGGVRSGRDAYDKLAAGASLVQLYTGMVYEGPGLVSRIRDELAVVVQQSGHKTIKDVVGIDHPDLYWSRRYREAELTSPESAEEDEGQGGVSNVHFAPVVS